MEYKFLKQIKEYINVTYNNSLRFIKPKMFIKQFGVDAYHDVINNAANVQPFSLQVYHYINQLQTTPLCKMCSNYVKFNTNKGYQTYCSNTCRFKDMDNIQHVKRATNLTKYGATNVLASAYGKEASAKTLIQKYGVNNYTKTEEYVNRIKSGDIVRKMDISKQKDSRYSTQYNELLQHKLIRPVFTRSEYKGCNNIYNVMCVKCKHVYQHNFLRIVTTYCCPNCNKDITGTRSENILKQLLLKHNIPFRFRARKEFNNEFEIDLYIPSKNIGIEIHGLYWHSDKKIEDKYHINKLKMCGKYNVRLIQIFEDEIKHKQHIVISRLKHILGCAKYKIGARKCTIEQLNYNDKSKFINKYHIQGDCASKHNYGLFYKNRLIAVATFGAMRLVVGNKSQENTFELLRYCTVSQFNVQGGMSKLLKHFINTHKPSKIVSYADLRWSQGNVYLKSGFKFIKQTEPNYWYTKNFIKREHRFGYRKSELKLKLTNFDANLSERKNMENAGYARIYDCGAIRFEHDCISI